jgi:hypothetical protein
MQTPSTVRAWAHPQTVCLMRQFLLTSVTTKLCRCTGDQGCGEVDELADNMSDVASLASDMSAYTDRSTAAASTRTSGSSASTIGGRGTRQRKRRSGKIRQGTPDEEQKLSLLICDLAPSSALCTQVWYLLLVSSTPCLASGCAYRQFYCLGTTRKARPGAKETYRCDSSGDICAHGVQISQLMELLVLLGHEADAAKLQEAVDAYAKAFVLASEDMLDHPAPPANSMPASKEAAQKTVLDLHNKLYELKRTAWKWELLRPVG